MDEFIGTIKMFMGENPPKGWELCDGQLLLIKNHRILYHIIGTHYGGDGITTFALPDLRGRTPIGCGQGKGFSNYRLGETGRKEQENIHKEYVRAGTPTETGVGGIKITVIENALNIVAPPPYISINFIISVHGFVPYEIS